MIPALPFDTTGLDASMLTAPFTILLLSILAGLLAGKQEHDAAKISGDQAKINDTIWDWAEDGAYGLLGGIVGFGLNQTGLLQIPVIFIPVMGFAGRKVLLDLATKYTK